MPGMRFGDNCRRSDDPVLRHLWFYRACREIEAYNATLRPDLSKGEWGNLAFVNRYREALGVLLVSAGTPTPGSCSPLVRSSPMKAADARFQRSTEILRHLRGRGVEALRRATLVLWADHCTPLGRPLRTIPDSTRPRCRLYSLADVELALAAARDAADEYVIEDVRWVWLTAAARRHGVSRTLLRRLRPTLPSGTWSLLVRHRSGKVKERTYVRADEVAAVGKERSGVRVPGDAISAAEIRADPAIGFTYPFLRRWGSRPHPLLGRCLLPEPKPQFRRCGDRVRHSTVWPRAPLLELAALLRENCRAK